MTDQRAQIQGWIRAGLAATREPATKQDTSTPSVRLFNYLVDHIETNVIATTFAELKERSTKAKGDLWELFCQMYLEAHGYVVYRLKETPRDIAEYLKLVKPGKEITDVGIDLVAVNAARQPIAIQCKYRFCNGIKNKWRPSGKTGITWAALSTFYALCARTGPWAQRWVMTNCDYVSRKGETTKEDVSLTKANFGATDMAAWKLIAPPLSNGHSLLPVVPAQAGDSAKPSHKEVCDKRAALLAKLAKPPS